MSDLITNAELAEWKGLRMDSVNNRRVALAAMPRLLDEVERMRKALIVIRNWPFGLMGDGIAEARRIAAEGLGGGG